MLARTRRWRAQPGTSGGRPARRTTTTSACSGSAPTPAAPPGRSGSTTWPGRSTRSRTSSRPGDAGGPRRAHRRVQPRRDQERLRRRPRRQRVRGHVDAAARVVGEMADNATTERSTSPPRCAVGAARRTAGRVVEDAGPLVCPTVTKRDLGVTDIHPMSERGEGSGPRLAGRAGLEERPLDGGGLRLDRLAQRRVPHRLPAAAAGTQPASTSTGCGADGLLAGQRPHRGRHVQLQPGERRPHRLLVQRQAADAGVEVEAERRVVRPSSSPRQLSSQRPAPAGSASLRAVGGAEHPRHRSPSRPRRRTRRLRCRTPRAAGRPSWGRCPRTPGRLSEASPRSAAKSRYWSGRTPVTITSRCGSSIGDASTPPLRIRSIRVCSSISANESRSEVATTVRAPTVGA